MVHNFCPGAIFGRPARWLVLILCVQAVLVALGGAQAADLLPDSGLGGGGGFGAVGKGGVSVVASGGWGLDQLVALAVQNHPGVASKRADLNAAEANQDLARWQYFPAPSLQLRQEKGSGVVVVALQQPLWAAGGLDAGLGAATSRVHSAVAGISEAQYSLALRVTGVWQSWWQARGRVEVLLRARRGLGAYAESVRLRIKGGVSPEADRMLVGARIAQLEGDLSAARAAERGAFSELSQLLGGGVRVGDLFVGRSEVEVPSFDALLERSISGSAAIGRVGAELEAARYDVAQKRAALWPTFGVRAEYQRGDSSLGARGSISDSKVMFEVSYLPGAGLSAGAGVSAAEARVANLRESLEAVRLELVAKVSADYEDCQSSLGRERSTRLAVNASAEVLSSYDRLFVAGKRNWLDVLNAARELMQVELSLVDVEAVVTTSCYRLRLHGNELPWQQGGLR